MFGKFRWLPLIYLVVRYRRRGCFRDRLEFEADGGVEFDFEFDFVGNRGKCEVGVMLNVGDEARCSLRRGGKVVNILCEIRGGWFLDGRGLLWRIL